VFKLARAEFNDLISQSAISSSSWGGRRKLPLAFTWEGAAMLSGKTFKLYNGKGVDNGGNA